MYNVHAIATGIGKTSRGYEEILGYACELLCIVELPGALPGNVASFRGGFSGHLAIPCLNGMILILDGADRVVSAIDGESPVYSSGKLHLCSSFNYTSIILTMCVWIILVLYMLCNGYPVKLFKLALIGSIG